MNLWKARSPKTQQTWVKKCTLVLVVFCVAALVACHKEEELFKRSAYLDLLQDKAGFKTRDDLIVWGVISGEEDLDLALDRDFVAVTLSALLPSKTCKSEFDDLSLSAHPDALKTLVAHKIILPDNNKVYPKDHVDQNEAKAYLDKAVLIIDNQEFESSGEYEFKEDFKEIETYEQEEDLYYFDLDLGVNEIVLIDNMPYKIIAKEAEAYRLEKASFEEVFSELKFSYSGSLDLSEAIVVDDMASQEVTSIYDDNSYERLSSNTKVIEKDGYRISYSLSLNKIHLRVSKKTQQGLNAYFDADIKNIRPSYKWDYGSGVIKEAYLKIDFETNEEIGLSKANYKRYFMDFSSLDYGELVKSIPLAIKPQSELVETSFTLFKIKLPLANIPFVNLMAEVKLNIYVGGHIELVLDTDHSLGLAIKNNALRVIGDHDFASDGQIYAKAKTSLGLDFDLQALGFALLDIKTEAGIEAKAQATLHLFDSEGKVNSFQNTQDYDLLEDLYEDNPDTRICGDLSLNWLLDVILNSDDTLAYRLGLTHTFHILDEDDQIFHNRSHFENGQFVEKCTVHDRTNIKVPSSEELDPETIILSTYSLVLKEDETAIPLKAWPKDYSKNELLFKVEDDSIVKIAGDKLLALKPGATKVRIYTMDEKYEVYLNVLVSYGNTSPNQEK